MGDLYRRSDVNGISIGMSIWDMGYRYGIWMTDTVIYHIDRVILDIDTLYWLIIGEMTVSICSSPISIWDILSRCTCQSFTHAHIVRAATLIPKP